MATRLGVMVVLSNYLASFLVSVDRRLLDIKDHKQVSVVDEINVAMDE